MQAIELSSLDGFRKGDLAVISDEMTQEEFGAGRVKFNITSVRTFANTPEDVKYTGYVLSGVDEEEGDQLMLVITEIGGFYDISLYFLDNEGDLNKEDGAETPDYGALIDHEDKMFADHILLRDGSGEEGNEIHWVRHGDSRMNLAYYDENGVDEAAICEYLTEDVNYGNDRALIICKGPIEKCKVEMWYGYKLQDHEAELFSEGTEL